MSSAFTSFRRSRARVSCSRSKPASRVQSWRYGEEVLSLQAAEPLDRPRNRELCPIEEELARQERAVELSPREHPLRHGLILPEASPPKVVEDLAQGRGRRSAGQPYIEAVGKARTSGGARQAGARAADALRPLCGRRRHRRRFRQRQREAGSPPGQGEASTATGKPCRDDPQPEHGKDCEAHGNQGGVNEDHCGGVTAPEPPPPTTIVNQQPPPTTTVTTTTTQTTTSTPSNPPRLRRRRRHLRPQRPSPGRRSRARSAHRQRLRRKRRLRRRTPCEGEAGDRRAEAGSQRPRHPARRRATPAALRPASSPSRRRRPRGSFLSPACRSGSSSSAGWLRSWPESACGVSHARPASGRVARQTGCRNGSRRRYRGGRRCAVSS